MLFHSLEFLLLLLVTFAAYWRFHRSTRIRLSVLLVASVLFYAAWNPYPLLIFLSIAVVNSVASKLLAKTRKAGSRKAIMAVAVGYHLGTLCTFKYADLFLSTLAAALARLGIASERTYQPLGILLPIGLSFVVFTAIAYIVDVYRNEAAPSSVKRQLLYLLFFPQTIAGPILRSKDLLAQFDEVPKLSPDDGARAIFRFATGIAKKMLIGDVLSVALINPVFDNPGLYTSTETAVAVVAYTFQIYFDFSAYTDLAIGLGALFGFKYPENFNKPYHAKNLFEFWNRWHMTLSNWLRDYLYRPLGGNRVARWKVCRNLFLVMALGGLWHGADWRFALWGGIHGVLLVGTRLWWWYVGKAENPAPLRKALGWAATFTAVCLTRVFFRAEDVAKAFAIYEQLLLFTTGFANVSRLAWGTLAFGIVAYALPPSWHHRLGETFGRMPVLARATALVALGLLIRQVASFEMQPYIYFQF